VSIYKLPDRTYLFEAESDVLKDFGIPEENMRAQRTAQRTARTHLTKFAKEASEIRQAVKSPAELAAGKAQAMAEERMVVGGEPIAEKEHPELKLVTPKRKIRGIFDID
jgi:vacuolar-type H+-ATPase subunit E/Vma4